MGLYPVRMETALGLAFVNLSGDAPPLREWLGDLLVALDEYLPALETPGALVATYRKTYQPKADWKVLVENFLEYYHLPAVHPALCDVSGVDEHTRRQGKGMYMCFATDPLNGESTSGSTALDPGRLHTFPGCRNTNSAASATPPRVTGCPPHRLGRRLLAACVRRRPTEARGAVMRRNFFNVFLALPRQLLPRHPDPTASTTTGAALMAHKESFVAARSRPRDLRLLGQ